MTHWYVVDMDDGLVRKERSKGTALRWAMDHQCVSERILPGPKRLGEGMYEYFVGDTREDATQVWICRGDRLSLHGFDPEQIPLYPHADDPFQPEPREGKLDD